MPKSFRLTPKAEETLRQIAQDFEISESRVINILLTEPTYVDGSAIQVSAAKRIIQLYFINKAEQKGI